MDLDQASSIAGDSLPPDNAAVGGVVPSDQSQTQEANTAVDPYADVTGLPWGQDPRFQQFLTDRKEFEALRQSAAQIAEYDPYKPMIDDLRKNGINSYDDLQSRLAAQRAEETERQEASQRLAPIAQDLITRRDAGEISPELAEELFQQKQQLDQINRDYARTQNELMDMRLQSLQAKPEYARLDPDYVRAVVRATGRSVDVVAAESHAKVLKLEQQVLANYNASKATDAALSANQPQGGGANGPSANIGGMPDFTKDPAAFDLWWKQQEALGAQIKNR